MKIGFIGLGIMGRPMVKNLLKAGHEVLAYDILPENMEILQNLSAHGFGGNDHSGIARYYERLTGTEIRK